MLDDIKKLGDTISIEQDRALKKDIGEELFKLLDSMLESETEDEARERVDIFISYIKKKPLRILKAKKILNEPQLDIILRFLGDDE